MSKNNLVKTKLYSEYSKFIQDGNIQDPKLSVKFIKPEGNIQPNIIINYTKDKASAFVQLSTSKDNENKANENHEQKCIINFSTEDKTISHLNLSEKVTTKIIDFITKSDLDEFICYMDESINMEHVAQFCIAEYYSFDLFTDNAKKPKTISFICNNNHREALINKANDIITIGNASRIVRYLMDMPPNYLQPSEFALLAQSIASKIDNLQVELVDAEIVETKMGCLYGVGKGSNDKPQMIILKWLPNKNEKPMVIAGKGITFDTGGYSLKTGGYMRTMKTDMGGAANTLMTLYTVAKLNIQQNVIGILACAENCVANNAYKPDDVLHVYPRTSPNASKVRSVEIDNTDAEGRLVLADAIAYSQEHYDPSAIIDIATLTGAIKIALGTQFSGLFSNNDKLCNALQQASKNAGHRTWHLPAHDELYGSSLSSPVADIKNLADSATGAGSTTAAVFLQKFIDDGRPWAHFDIAADMHQYSTLKILVNMLQTHKQNELSFTH